MAAIVTTAAQRSWAQIVKPEAEETETKKSQKSLQPATRGSLMRFCRGEVLKMVSNYGWLMVYGKIDHPSVEKHGGDVYIHKDDVVDGESLAPGDVVTFYLYVDDKGLGAEYCQVEEKAGARQGFNRDATPFVPKPASQNQGFKLNAGAKDFMPKSTQVYSDMLWRLSQVFDSDDEDESDDEGDRGATKALKAPSSDGSTRGGETSDSEEESSCGGTSDSETEATPVKSPSLQYHFRPPPGLSLPKVHKPVFCLPPGLSPPGLDSLVY